MSDLPKAHEIAALQRVWRAIPSTTMPTLERMIEIIEAQAEEIERLRSKYEDD